LTRAHPTVWLLDANLLIALTQAAHIHHAEAHAWLAHQPKRPWATCALTQLAFVRLTSNPQIVGERITPAQALQALVAMTAQPQHVYWPEAPEPMTMATLSSAAIVGHRQVTDAYLLGLAAIKRQCLATLDRGLVAFAQAVGLAGNVELVSSTGIAVQEPATSYSAKHASKSRR